MFARHPATATEAVKYRVTMETTRRMSAPYERVAFYPAAVPTHFLLGLEVGNGENYTAIDLKYRDV